MSNSQFVFSQCISHFLGNSQASTCLNIIERLPTSRLYPPKQTLHLKFSGSELTCRKSRSDFKYCIILQSNFPKTAKLTSFIDARIVEYLKNSSQGKSPER